MGSGESKGMSTADKCFEAAGGMAGEKIGIGGDLGREAGRNIKDAVDIIGGKHKEGVWKENYGR